MATTKDKVIRRIGSQDEAPSSWNTRPTNIPSGSSGLTTDQRRAIPPRRIGSNNEAPSSFGTKPTNVPDEYGLTTDQRRAGITTRDLEVIDTSQPSPGSTPIGAQNAPGIVPFEQASTALAKGMAGESSAAIQSATDAMRKKYYGGFQQTMESGTQAPSAQGQAQSQIQQTLPVEPEAPPPLEGVLGDYYKGVQDLTTKYAEYYDPENQKSSLMDSYNKLYKQSGLEQLDEEIIDAKSIIEGTEDDIRNEIEMAGGMGTDSQVQALALSRNKVLLKNYNNLVAMREMKQNNLDTMLDIADKDRTYADNQIDRMFNYEVQMNSLREKFIQNARDQYNKYTPQQLQAMLVGNPRQLAFAEKILGVGIGGIDKLANAPLSEKDQLDLDLKRSALKTDELQRANLRSQISERNNTTNETGTITGKPQNASQSAANSYANRLAEANISINNLGNKFTGKFSQLPAFNFMKSSDRQVYEQSQKNFITAVLRRESGASIAPSEFETAADVYFPQPGDRPDVVKRKASVRNLVINNFYREANVLRPVSPGDIVEDNGKQYKVGADGETLEEI